MRCRLGCKRVAAAVYLAWLLFCFADYQFDWPLLGSSAKRALSLTVFLGVLISHRYGANAVRELRAYRRLKRMCSNASVVFDRADSR
jgi:hypothetical protein